MKILCILFLMFLFVGNVIGQIPEGIKYDRLAYSFDSTSVLLFKGKSVSIIDCINNTVVLGPTKNTVLNFPNSNVYAEIPLKSGDLWIHFLLEGTKISFRGSDSACYLGMDHPLSRHSIIDMNGKLYDYATADFAKSEQECNCKWSEFEIKKQDNNFYILNRHQNGFQFLNSQDEWIYTEGFNSSGIYSLEKNKWCVSPKYKWIYTLNDFIFCVDQSVYELSKNEEGSYQEPLYNSVYDVYHVVDSEINNVKFGTKDLGLDLLANILGADQVLPTSVYNYFYTKQNSKWGLIKFELFETDYLYAPQFTCDVILPIHFDFLYFEPAYHQAVTFTVNDAEQIQLYDIEWDGTLHHLISDSSFVQYNLSNEVWMGESLSKTDSCFVISWTENTRQKELIGQFCTNEFTAFGLNYLNDSLLILKDVTPNGAFIPYMSVVNYPEDSLDENGNTVGYPIERGTTKSGVYNLNSEEWIVNPEYVSVAVYGTKFLTTQANGGDSPLSLDQISYSAVNFDGSILFENKGEGDLKQNLDLLKLIAPFNRCDTIFEAPSGFNKHSRINEHSTYFYVTSGNQLGVYAPYVDFTNSWTNELFEFVHYNPSFDFYFYLDGDSIRLNCEFGKMAVSRSGKIIFSQVSMNNDPLADYYITIIDTGDTSYYGEITGFPESLTTASIEIKNGVLVVNDCTKNAGWMCESCVDENGRYFTQIYQFDSENSSVWKNRNGVWTKLSPYYASIEPIKTNKYIASSGNYYWSDDADQNIETTGSSIIEETIEARYFLLDSNLKVIPYMDYFDFADIQDLGFGLKVKLNTGDKYFFMTYNLQAITNAEWDHFEIEKGKLRAIINATYQLDSNGDWVLDEFGNPIEEISQTVKYFKLP